MVAVTFDTLEFTEQLKAAGVPEEQAKGHAKALTVVMRQTETHIDERIEKHGKQSEERLDGVATKQDIETTKLELRRDIKELEARMDAKLEKELAPVRTELAVVKWMLGVQMAGVLALILKSFFPH